MITLYQFGPAFGLPSLSPFCTKVEAYLRMTRLDFRAVEGDARQAPKGKLPYIEDGGTVISDSGFIVEHCKLAYNRDPDEGLTAGQRATGLAVRRMLEEHLYWVLIYARWIDEEGWGGGYREAIGSMMPSGLKQVGPGLLRRRLRTALNRQGLGLHSRAEVYALGVSDLDAVADLLGEQPFLFGDALSSCDATVHAFLWHVAETPGDNPLKRAVARRGVLADYVKRNNRAWGFDGV